MIQKARIVCYGANDELKNDASSIYSTDINSLNYPVPVAIAPNLAPIIDNIRTGVEAVNFTVTDNEAEGILYDINDVDKKFNLMVECLSSEDYPSIEDTVEQSVIDIEMDSTILLKGLDAIKDSVSTEDSKPYLQGINLKPDLIDNPIYNGQSNGTGNIDNNNSTTNTNLLVPSNHIKLASTNASILKFLYCEVVNVP